MFDDYSGADHKMFLQVMNQARTTVISLRTSRLLSVLTIKLTILKKLKKKNDFDDNSFEDNDNEFGYTDEEDNKENVKKKEK